MRYHSHVAIFALLSLFFLPIATVTAQSPSLDHNFILLMAARNAVKAGKPEKALTRYRTLLSTSSHPAEVQQEFGWLLITMKRFTEAEQQFQHTIDAQPTHTAGWTGLLEVYRQTSNTSKLMTTLTHLITLDPSNRDIRAQLALELHNHKRYTEAETHLTILLQD